MDIPRDHKSSSFRTDGIQDTLPQEMVLWHIEYFKLRVWERAEVEQSFWPSAIPLTSPLKQVIRPSSERCPPWRKGTSLLQTWSSPEKSPNKQVFLVSPNCGKNFLCLPRTPQPNVFLHSSPPFIKLSIKTLGFNCLLGSSFPCEGSYVM